MKQLLVAITCLSLISCGSNDTVILTREEYQLLKNDTVHLYKYPKIIQVPSTDSYNAKSFEVWLGSDGHEYQRHEESHVDKQWVHYAGCELCKSRYDSLLYNIKLRR